ncbi:unnamed protein product [Schistosoma bovis]|nr:unnamed protein product [Schistosoma bovis]
MINEDIKPEIDKNNLIMSDQKPIEPTLISSLQRLSMAVKLVKSMEKLPSQVSGSVSENNNPDHTNLIQSNEITNRNDDNDVLTVKVLKKAGEILGLELELESGDERGIKLVHITPGSPVDSLKYWNKYKSMNYIQTDSSDYSKLSDTSCINDDHLRIPTAGDRILSVSDYSFQNMSAFTALRLLRKLISYSSFIKSQMISHTNNYTDQQYNYFPKPFILNKTNTNINTSDNITNKSNDNDNVNNNNNNNNNQLIHLNKHSSSFKSILNTETTSKLDQSFRSVKLC